MARLLKFYNMKNTIKTLMPPLFLLAAVTGCSHSIKIKGARFAAPTVGEKQWSGFISLSGSADTRITLIENIDGNPPTRNPVRINEDADAGDLLGLNFLGFEAALSPLKAVEIYLDNSLIGLRWQFLNHGKGPLVAALQAGHVSGSQGTSYEEDSGSSSAESDIDRTQAGISFGYQVNENIMPYVSYLHENYEVETRVTNSNGNFGPYDDEGQHQFLAIGVMSPRKGVFWAIEYNYILIDWDRALDDETQNAVGIRIGGAWGGSKN